MMRSSRSTPAIPSQRPGPEPTPRKQGKLTTQHKNKKQPTQEGDALVKLHRSQTTTSISSTSSLSTPLLEPTTAAPNILLVGNMPRHPSSHMSEITSVLGSLPGLIRLSFDSIGKKADGQTTNPIDAYPNLRLTFATVRDCANARAHINHNAVIIASKRVWTL